MEGHLWTRRVGKGIGLGLLLAAQLASCSLLPVSGAAALPPPDQMTPGYGVKVFHDASGAVSGRSEYMVDNQGRVWRHGTEWTYWPDGRTRSERNFDHDEPRGAWKTFWESGGLRSEYVADEFEATRMSYFHSNGQLASQGVARRGRREGLWTYWYADGVIQEVGHLVDGQRHGVWKTYFPDASAESAGRYELGDKVAGWEYWQLGERPNLDPEPEH